MATNHLATDSNAGAVSTDDLKIIRGIGPAIETKLHNAGIFTFAQLAGMSPAELASLFPDFILFSEDRITKEDWVGQARLLGDQYSIEPIFEEALLQDGQHYAVFTVELLLDRTNIVRRTQVKHVQSQNENIWAGWEEARLLKFIRENAALNIIAQQAAVISEPRQETKQPESIEAPVQKMTPAITDVAGQMRLADMVIEVAENKGVQVFVYNDQLFNINLTLDLADLRAPRDVPLAYSAMVYAKKVGGGYCKIVGSSVGTLLPADTTNLDIKGIQLSRGVYHIEVIVELKPPIKSVNPANRLMAVTEGSLLQVI